MELSSSSGMLRDRASPSRRLEATQRQCPRLYTASPGTLTSCLPFCPEGLGSFKGDLRGPLLSPPDPGPGAKTRPPALALGPLALNATSPGLQSKRIGSTFPLLYDRQTCFLPAFPGFCRSLCGLGTRGAFRPREKAV